MRSLALTACALALAVSGCAGDTSGSSERPAQDDLVARWWNWAAVAEPDNPVSDRDGSQCAHGQPDDVWFLAGSWGETVRRTCRIPSGVPVFGPVANQVCPIGADSVASVRSSCTAEWDVARVLLDGEEVAVEDRESDGDFRLTVPVGSPLFDEGGATIDAYGSGVWFGPMDLADGDHTLRILARGEGFALDVTYRLAVG